MLQKPLKFSDAISKALAIYALSARRITKLLRKKTYSKFLSGKLLFFVNNTAVSKANAVRFTKKRYFHFRTTVNGELFSTNFHA